MHLHSARGAKFLTAKAFYAKGTVNDRFFVTNGYCLGGANVAAFAAAHAVLSLKHGAGFKQPAKHRRYPFSVGVKQHAVTYCDILVVLYRVAVK